MAVQIYQNQTAFEVIVPTADGSMSVYPNEYVGGSYYAHIPELVNVTNQSIDPLDVKYFYPESGESGTSLNGFDTATGTLPIQVDVVGTTFNVSIQPISGTDIGDGQVVRTLNTLTDTVVITGQAGISVDVNVGNNSIDITNTQLGLTDVYATAPLYLELGEGNVSLSGSIAITPTDNGGAVALQAFEDPTVVEYQNGFAGLKGLHLSVNGGDVVNASRPYVFGIYYSPDNNSPLLGINALGRLMTSTDINTAGVLRSSQIRLYENVTFNTTTGEVDTLGRWIDLQGNPMYETYFDVPVMVRGEVRIGVESGRLPGTFGYISGVQTDTNSSSLITLRKGSSTNTTPLIRTQSSQVYPGLTNSTVFEYVDDDDVSLVSIHDDGVVTAKKLEADTIDVTTVFADNIFSSTLYVVGPDTVVMTTAGGPRTIIADCSNGPVVVQLPDLTAFDKSLKVTALKADTSNNALSFVNGPNSTINGSPLSVSIVDQYAGKTITSAGINWYITSTVG